MKNNESLVWEIAREKINAVRSYNNLVENLYILGNRENYDWLVQSKEQLESENFAKYDLSVGNDSKKEILIEKGKKNMPEISLFYGIRVTMYYNDHMPPHFHAEYNGNNALIDINNIQVIKGYLPNKQMRLILAWCTIHQDELMQNWELSKDMKPLNRINPLI